MSDLLLHNKIPEVLNLFDKILSKGFEGHHFINGLASHFRDLLVAKDKKTVELLEVGDSAKKKYLQQSTEATIPFLMQSIEISNTCELNYKTSKNQRLLVELALMQIASITFESEKKKSKSFIIPATFFQTTYTPKVKKEPVIEKKVEASVVAAPEVELPKKTPILKSVSRRTNSLTLKSVIEKKVDEESKETQVNLYDQPKDPFTEKKVQSLWIEYYQERQKKGEKSIASILELELPKLYENFELSVSLPSKLMKEQLEREQPKLLGFLKKELNNYSITLKINVVKTVKQKIAYTTREKYEELKAKNPLLDKLRQTFELDL
jgi:DNA polymerase-3 subunit gamma/tau